MVWQPKRLVFTGGGTRCLVFVDALLILESAGVLKSVNDYWGTSAGAFLATIMALTNSVSKMNECMRSTDYVKFRDVDINNLLSINKTWGLDNGHSLMKEIERILDLIKPGSKDLKMANIPNLTIIISDLTDHKLILCSAKTYPNLHVIEAIRASMSLPLFFRPYIYKENGHIWVDGAVGANFPWMLLPTDKDREESLGFTFEHGNYDVPNTLSEYLFSVIHFQEPNKIHTLKSVYPMNIIWFPKMPFPSWFMRLTESDFTMITNIGEIVAHKWLSTHFNANSAPPSCSPHPPETSGSSLPCEDHRNPSQADPLHHTEQTSGSLKSSGRGPPQDSSRPQLPVRRPICRRWSW